MICDHQHMLIASLGLFQREEVEAHQLQWTGGDDVHKMCTTVRWSLSPKATGAFLDPFVNIFGHPRPIEPVSYQRKCSIATHMSDVVMQLPQNIGNMLLRKYELFTRLPVD